MAGTFHQQCTTPEIRGHICLDCARQGLTCCQEHDIYVTAGDCQRIRRHTRSLDFFEYRGCSHAAYADQEDDPLWRQYVFRDNGSRRVLKRMAGGDCHFLGPAGCSLPLSVRPLVCRLYPHLYSADGIAGMWDSECPAARTHANLSMAAGIAGVDPQEAVLWHRMLYTEILGEADSDGCRFDR